MLNMEYIKKTEFDHMENIKQPVKEICPKTGEYIEPVEIPKKLTVNHFFKKFKHLPDDIQCYREIGINKMTEEQLEECYKLIKEHKSCKIV